MTQINRVPGMYLIALPPVFSDKQDSGAVQENDQGQNEHGYNPFVNHQLRVPAIIAYQGALSFQVDTTDGSIIVS